MADSVSDQYVYATYRFDTVSSEKIRPNYCGLAAKSDSVSDRLVNGHEMEVYGNPRSDRLVHGYGILEDASPSSDRLVHSHGNPPTEVDIIGPKANDPAIDKEIRLHRQSLMAKWHQQLLYGEEAQRSHYAEWKSLLEQHGGLDSLRAALTERVNSLWGKHRKRMRLVGHPERCVGGSVLPSTLQKEVEECSSLLRIGSPQCANFVNTDTVVKLYTLECLKAHARDGS